MFQLFVCYSASATCPCTVCTLPVISIIYLYLSAIVAHYIKYNNYIIILGRGLKKILVLITVEAVSHPVITLDIFQTGVTSTR